MQTADWIAIYKKGNINQNVTLAAIPKSQPDILYDFGQHSQMSKAMKIIDKSHITQFGEHQNQGPLVQRYTLRGYFATIALSVK